MGSQKVMDVMTPSPTSTDAAESILAAAQVMASQDVGAVLVNNGARTVGIVTDRDIVVRGLAQGLGLDAPVAQVLSDQLVTVRPDDPVEQAVQVMRDAAVRRVPVMDGDTAVGIVSIGDLAVERDPTSALADISDAEPNK